MRRPGRISIDPRRHCGGRLHRDYGKPRPAVVVQSDAIRGLGSVILCPIASDRDDAPAFRIDVDPSDQNGLRLPSQIMADKIAAAPAREIATTIGRLEGELLAQLDGALAAVLGLGGAP